MYTKHALRRCCLEGMAYKTAVETAESPGDRRCGETGSSRSTCSTIANADKTPSQIRFSIPDRYDLGTANQLFGKSRKCIGTKVYVKREAGVAVAADHPSPVLRLRKHWTREVCISCRRSRLQLQVDQSSGRYRLQLQNQHPTFSEGQLSQPPAPTSTLLPGQISTQFQEKVSNKRCPPKYPHFPFLNHHHHHHQQQPNSGCPPETAPSLAQSSPPPSATLSPPRSP